MNQQVMDATASAMASDVSGLLSKKKLSSTFQAKMGRHNKGTLGGIRLTAASAAILAIETLIPAPAQAEDMNAQVRLASAFSPAVMKPLAAPVRGGALFGSTEIKSNDIRAFTKWTSTMERFEQQMNDKAHTPRIQMWKAQLAGMKGKSVREQITAVNDYVNQTRYIEDKVNYGKSDQWATPVEFFAKGGDCEDFAIAKFASLRALGFAAESMRIAIVQDKIKNIAHAVLVVYTEEGNFVLDNQNKRVEMAENVARYKPVFSITSNSWWLHRVQAGV